MVEAFSATSLPYGVKTHKAVLVGVRNILEHPRQYHFKGGPFIVPQGVKLSLTDTKIAAVKRHFGCIDILSDEKIYFFVFDKDGLTYILPIPFDENTEYVLMTKELQKG